MEEEVKGEITKLSVLGEDHGIEPIHDLWYYQMGVDSFERVQARTKITQYYAWCKQGNGFFTMDSCCLTLGIQPKIAQAWCQKYEEDPTKFNTDKNDKQVVATGIYDTFQFMHHLAEHYIQHLALQGKYNAKIAELIMTSKFRFGEPKVIQEEQPKGLTLINDIGGNLE